MPTTNVLVEKIRKNNFQLGTFIWRPVGNFAFLASELNFLKILSGIPSESNSLKQYQARYFAPPELGPNCLQRLSAARPIKL